MSSVLEPLCTKDTAGKLGDYAIVDIAAFVSAPRYKAGAPLHTRAEAIPAPVRFSAIIPDLGQGNGDDLVIAISDAIEDGSRG